MKLLIDNNRIIGSTDDSYQGPDVWIQGPSNFTIDLLEFVVITNNELDIKATLWNKIKDIRDTRVQNSGYKVGSKWFHSDTFSRSQQIGLVILGASIPAGLMWKTMDGSFIEMTQVLSQQIFATAAASDMAIFGFAESLKAQVNASSDPLSVPLTGWPVGFGD